MKVTPVLTAAAALVASLLASPASAVTAYCDPVSNGVVSGSIVYSPPLFTQAPAMQPVQWKLDLHMVCTGAAPVAGTYDMTIHGFGAESCTTGGGQGVVVSGTKSGAAPGHNGPIVGGSVQLTRIGVHYWGYPPYGSGNVTVETPERTTFTIHVWLDNVLPVVERGATPCPGHGTPILGHAAVIQ